MSCQGSTFLVSVPQNLDPNWHLLQSKIMIWGIQTNKKNIVKAEKITSNPKCWFFFIWGIKIFVKQDRDLELCIEDLFNEQWMVSMPPKVDISVLSFFSSIWEGRAILVLWYLNPSVLFRCRKDPWLVQPPFTYTTEWQSTWYIHFQDCNFNCSPTTPPSCPFVLRMQLSHSWMLSWCSMSKLRYLDTRAW